MSGRMVWTAEMDSEFCRLRAEGKKLREIAEIMEIPVSKIRNRYRRADFPRKNLRWTAEKDETLIGMYADGETTAEIARTVGTTAMAVSTRIHRLKESGAIKRPKKRYWTADDHKELLKMKDEGRSLEEIAEHFGVSNWAVLQRVYVLSGECECKSTPKRTVWTTLMERKVVDSWKRGVKSAEMIADELGIPERVVSRKIYQLKRRGTI